MVFSVLFKKLVQIWKSGIEVVKDNRVTVISVSIIQFIFGFIVFDFQCFNDSGRLMSFGEQELDNFQENLCNLGEEICIWVKVWFIFYVKVSRSSVIWVFKLIKRVLQFFLVY